MDWVITIPKTIKWEDYEVELDNVKYWNNQLLYRVPYNPKKVQPSDRLFIVWNGEVRGWMKITGVIYKNFGFFCSTTGKFWKPGWYIARSGPFEKIKPLPMKGFQGLRKYNII